MNERNALWCTDWHCICFVADCDKLAVADGSCLVSVKPPSAATLKKYGMTANEWTYIWEYQESVCAICKKVPESGILHVDHFHAKGFKKMKPEDRKRQVRGILCAYCNQRILVKGINLFKARNIVTYLEDFEERRK